MNAPEVRIEIPSVEHPRLLAALLDEAKMRGVTVNRISQGGGSQFLTEAETEEFLRLAHSAGIEVYTYTSCRNSFGGLVDPLAGEQLRGEAAFSDALNELRVCTERGFDGTLVADLGLLASAHELELAGEPVLKRKTAVAIGPTNAATAALYQRLGASSINVPGSASLDDLRAMRRVLQNTVTLDIYVESSSDLGGGLRYREVAALALELSPVFLKFGLRNMDALYPYGIHLEPGAEASIREKVRRAELVSEELRRAGVEVIETLRPLPAAAGRVHATTAPNAMDAV